MKKLFIIALAITALVSCKDEKETPTPTPVVVDTFDIRPVASGIFVNDMFEGEDQDTLILRSDTTTTDKMVLSEKRGNQSRVIDTLTLIENGPDGLMSKGSGRIAVTIEMGHFSTQTDRWTFDVVIGERRDTYYYRRVK